MDGWTDRQNVMSVDIVEKKSVNTPILYDIRCNIKQSQKRYEIGQLFPGPIKLQKTFEALNDFY